MDKKDEILSALDSAEIEIRKGRLFKALAGMLLMNRHASVDDLLAAIQVQMIHLRPVQEQNHCVAVVQDALQEFISEVRELERQINPT